MSDQATLPPAPPTTAEEAGQAARLARDSDAVKHAVGELDEQTISPADLTPQFPVWNNLIPIATTTRDGLLSAYERGAGLGAIEDAAAATGDVQVQLGGGRKGISWCQYGLLNDKPKNEGSGSEGSGSENESSDEETEEEEEEEEGEAEAKKYGAQPPEKWTRQAMLDHFATVCILDKWLVNAPTPKWFPKRYSRRRRYRGQSLELEPVEFFTARMLSAQLGVKFSAAVKFCKVFDPESKSHELSNQAMKKAWKRVRTAARKLVGCVEDKDVDMHAQVVPQACTVPSSVEEKFFDLGLKRLVLSEASKVALSAAAEDPQVDLRQAIQRSAPTFATDKPMFPPGEVSMSTNFRFQGERKTVALAQEQHNKALVDSTQENLAFRLSRKQLLASCNVHTELNKRADGGFEWPGEQPEVDLPACPAVTPGQPSVLSLMLGGTGIHLGAAVYREMAPDPSQTFFDNGPNDRARPHALLIDSEPYAIDSVLGARSACRGMFDAGQTMVLEGSQGGPVEDVAGPRVPGNQDKFSALVRHEMERMDSCQGIIVYHALNEAAGTGLAKSLLQLDVLPSKTPSLAFQLGTDPIRTSLNGPVDSITEFVGLDLARFDTRVLLSMNAVHNHKCWENMPSMTGIHFLLARAIVSATACLRPDGVTRIDVPDGLASEEGRLPSIARISDFGRNLTNQKYNNFCTLLYDEDRTGNNGWVPTNLLENPACRLGAYSLSGHYKFASHTVFRAADRPNPVALPPGLFSSGLHGPVEQTMICRSLFTQDESEPPELFGCTESRYGSATPGVNASAIVHAPDAGNYVKAKLDAISKMVEKRCFAQRFHVEKGDYMLYESIDYVGDLCKRYEKLATECQFT